MANILENQSTAARAAAARVNQEAKMNEPERDARCFLYSADCPEGRIFEGAEAIEAAGEDGWVDSPGAVKKTPAKRASGGKKAATNDDSS